MLEKITNPEKPAFDIATVKAHLREDRELEDELVRAYTDAATQEAERYTQRAVDRCNYRLSFDLWPFCASYLPGYTLPGFAIPIAPVVSLASIKYVDDNGDEQTLSEDAYGWKRTAAGALVFIKSSSFSAPALSSYASPVVWCDFTAGYAPDDGGAVSDPELKMPPAIRQAVFLTVGHFYANRESVTTGKQPAVMPRSAEWLLDFLRVYR